MTVKNTTGKTDRKFDTPEETLDLNAHIVDQELGDEKVGEGLANTVVGQKPPVLSGLPVESRRSAFLQIAFRYRLTWWWVEMCGTSYTEGNRYKVSTG